MSLLTLHGPNYVSMVYYIWSSFCTSCWKLKTRLYYLPPIQKGFAFSYTWITFCTHQHLLCCFLSNYAAYIPKIGCTYLEWKCKYYRLKNFTTWIHLTTKRKGKLVLFRQVTVILEAIFPKLPFLFVSPYLLP